MVLCLIASDLRKRGVICEVLLERWKAAWSGPGPNAEGGCPMCAPESLGFLINAQGKVNIFTKEVGLEVPSIISFILMSC